MPVIHGPTPNNRVELPDQIYLCGTFVSLDDFSDLVHECLNTLSGRFDEQLFGILAYVLPKEIETLGNVGDLGFLFRETNADVVFGDTDFYPARIPRSGYLSCKIKGLHSYQITLVADGKHTT